VLAINFQTTLIHKISKLYTHRFYYTASEKFRNLNANLTCLTKQTTSGFTFTLTRKRRVRRIAKSDFCLRRACPFVRLHRTDQLPLEFHEILYLSILENSSFINIGQKWRVLYMKPYLHLW